MAERQHVIAWWEKATQFRENVFLKFEATQWLVVVDDRFINKDNRASWYKDLLGMIGLRCFLGYMKPEEVVAQEAVFCLKNWFFVYLDQGGRFVLSYSHIFGNKVECRHSSEHQPALIFYHIKRYTSILQHPLDRGHALIYRKETNKSARVAMELWTLFALRNGILKDIRVLIAKTVWNVRHEWMV